MVQVLVQFKPLRQSLKTFKLEKLKVLEQFKPMGLGIKTFKLDN